jgi:hypothetical protein
MVSHIVPIEQWGYCSIGTFLAYRYIKDKHKYILSNGIMKEEFTMKCKNNPTIDCNSKTCDDCIYEKGIIEEAKNPDNAINGFTFLTEDGKEIKGLHLVERKGKR